MPACDPLIFRQDRLKKIEFTSYCCLLHECLLPRLDKQFKLRTAYYGDNLEVLRKYIKDESIDLSAC